MKSILTILAIVALFLAACAPQTTVEPAIAPEPTPEPVIEVIPTIELVSVPASVKTGEMIAVQWKLLSYCLF